MRFIKIIFLFFTVQGALACDMCGNFMGLTPYDNNSQLTLLHRYRIFNGYRNYQQTSRFFVPGAYYKTAHDPNGMPSGDSITEIRNHSSKDYESFKVYELRGKYFLHPRLEANVILLFQQIRTKFDDDKNTTTGLGDPSFFAAYHVIKRLAGYKARQRLIIGAGIKFPLGNYKILNDHGHRYFITDQNGSGSWDHFYYINYILSYGRWGVNSNSLLKLNGQNAYGERLANSWSQVLNIFVKLSCQKMSFYPALLLNYEYNKGVYVNNKLEEGTNMNLLMLGPSLDISYKKVVFNLSWQFNAYERVSSQSLSAAGRVVAGITFNFGQNKYLIKGRD